MSGYEKSPDYGGPGVTWRTWVGAAVIFAIGSVYGVATHRQSWFPISAIKSLQEQRPTVDIPTNPDYLWRVEFLRRFSGPADIAMVGDSTTSMADWSAIFPERSVVNLGVGRDNTAGILARMDTIEGRSLKRIFLMIGTNDLDDSANVGAVVERYQRIVNRLSASASVTVLSTLFVAEKWPEKNRRIAELNKRLQTMCPDGANCSFLDLNERLAPGGFLEPAMTIDGTHLTPGAYAVWAEEISPLITLQIPVKS